MPSFREFLFADTAKSRCAKDRVYGPALLRTSRSISRATGRENFFPLLGVGPEFLVFSPLRFQVARPSLLSALLNSLLLLAENLFSVFLVNVTLISFAVNLGTFSWASHPTGARGKALAADGTRFTSA